MYVVLLEVGRRELLHLNLRVVIEFGLESFGAFCVCNTNVIKILAFDL